MALEQRDRQHVEAALGYTTLGMLDEAHEALESVDPVHKTAPEVLIARLQLYRVAERWELMQAVARRLSTGQPEEPGWIADLAYATRRAESLEAARAILLGAEQRHPDEAIIAFNLSCYETQLGNIAEAKRWLAKAIKLEPKLRLEALDDPDLEPLWDDPLLEG